MEHLLNCHGEWQGILAALTALPLVGAWVRALLRTHNHHHTHDRKES